MYPRLSTCDRLPGPSHNSCKDTRSLRRTPSFRPRRRRPRHTALGKERQRQHARRGGWGEQQWPQRTVHMGRHELRARALQISLGGGGTEIDAAWMGVVRRSEREGVIDAPASAPGPLRSGFSLVRLGLGGHHPEQYYRSEFTIFGTYAPHRQNVTWMQGDGTKTPRGIGACRPSCASVQQPAENTRGVIIRETWSPRSRKHSRIVDWKGTVPSFRPPTCRLNLLTQARDSIHLLFIYNRRPSLRSCIIEACAT